MRIATYLSITEQEAKQLDLKLKDTPFESRTDFITACARTFLYGTTDPGHKNPGPLMENWIHNIRTIARQQETIRQTYFDILKELAFPVIAMRGSKTAYHLLRKDLERTMLERCGSVPPAEQMQTLMKAFEETHMPEIIRHRSETLKEHYFGENAA